MPLSTVQAVPPPVSGQILVKLNTHIADTTDVHGIADTSLLSVGPASATDNALARFDTTTGKLLQDGKVLSDDNGALSGVDGIQLNTTVLGTPSGAEGSIEWNITEHAMDLHSHIAGVTAQIPYEVWLPAKNNTAGTLTNGTPVVVSGYSGGYSITAADANNLSDSVCIGMLTHDCAAGGSAIVTRIGIVRGFDTSMLSVGNVYLASGGGLSSTRPEYPSAVIILGYCGVVDASAGQMVVDVRTDTLDAGYDGSATQKQEVTIVEDAGSLYFECELLGGGDLPVQLSGDLYTLDCTTGGGTGGIARSDAITPGGTTTTQRNYCWVQLVGGVPTLKAGTAFPSAPTSYAQIAWASVWSVAKHLTDGVANFRRTTDAKQFDGRGLLPRITENIRIRGASYISGCAPTVTLNTSTSIGLTTASGIVQQLHSQTWPSYDISTDGLWIANASGSGTLTNYEKVTDLANILEDANGDDLTGKRFNLVLWGAINKTTGDCKIYCNLPTDSYSSDSNCYNDINNTSVVSAPENLRDVAFLIGRIPIRHSTAGGGTWSLIGTALSKPTVIPLLGNPVGVSGSAAGSPAQQFSDAIFRVFDDADSSKILAFEVSGVTTATTRTLTIPDKSGTVVVDDGAAVSLSGTLSVTGDNARLTIWDNDSTVDRHCGITLTTASGTWKIDHGDEGSTTDTALKFITTYGDVAMELERGASGTPGTVSVNAPLSVTDTTDSTSPTSAASIKTLGGGSFAKTVSATTLSAPLISAPTSSNITVKMADAAGANKVSFTDSADAEVASIDSDGDLAVSRNAEVTGQLSVTSNAIFSMAQEMVGGIPSLTAYDATSSIISRTAGGVAAPFDQAGSIVYRPRVSSTDSRSSHFFYAGDPSAIRLTISASSVESTVPLSAPSIEAQPSSDLTVKLADAAGANKVSFTDSADAEVASIDSDGALASGPITSTGSLTSLNASKFTGDQTTNRLVIDGPAAANQEFYIEQNGTGLYRIGNFGDGDLRIRDEVNGRQFFTYDQSANKLTLTSPLSVTDTTDSTSPTDTNAAISTSGGGSFAKTITSTAMKIDVAGFAPFDFYSDRNTASQNIGGLRGFGKNSASEDIQYAEVRVGINDPTDGSEDGFVSIACIKAGSASSEVAVFDTSALTLASGVDLVTTAATAVTLDVEDNVSDVFKVAQGGNDYLRVSTTNGSESVDIGNSTTNPDVNIYSDVTLASGVDLVAAANVDFTGLPTSDPTSAGRLWNDSGTVKISAG